MGHIYYATLLFISTLLIGFTSRFFKVKNMYEWYNKYKKVTGKVPQKTDFRNEEEYNLFISVSVITFLELIILIGGLLTSSWYVYLTLLFLSIVINISIKPIEFSIFGKIISFCNQLFRLLVYIFLVINHFHLHKDILQFFI